jgi:hypothetical protein
VYVLFASAARENQEYQIKLDGELFHSQCGNNRTEFLLKFMDYLQSIEDNTENGLPFEFAVKKSSGEEAFRMAAMYDKSDGFMRAKGSLFRWRTYWTEGKADMTWKYENLAPQIVTSFEQTVDQRYENQYEVKIEQNLRTNVTKAPNYYSRSTKIFDIPSKEWYPTINTIGDLCDYFDNVDSTFGLPKSTPVINRKTSYIAYFKGIEFSFNGVPLEGIIL